MRYSGQLCMYRSSLRRLNTQCQESARTCMEIRRGGVIKIVDLDTDR